MNRFIASLIVATALAAPTISKAAAEDTKKVLMFVTDGSRDLELMLDEEVGVMKEMLEASGYQVVIAAVSAEKQEAGASEMTPDVTLDEAKMSDYGALILPCMAPAPGSDRPAKVAAMVEEAVASGKPVAASRGSVSFLAQAGVLEGKNYAFASDASTRPGFQDGTYVGTGVERDGAIATAGVCPLASRSLNLPDGTRELTQSFIDALNEKN